MSEREKPHWQCERTSQHGTEGHVLQEKAVNDRQHPGTNTTIYPAEDKGRLCYTEKAQNAWHRRGTQKTKTPTIHTNKMANSQTKHLAQSKGQPGSQDA